MVTYRYPKLDEKGRVLIKVSGAGERSVEFSSVKMMASERDAIIDTIKNVINKSIDGEEKLKNFKELKKKLDENGVDSRVVADILTFVTTTFKASKGRDISKVVDVLTLINKKGADGEAIEQGCVLLSQVYGAGVHSVGKTGDTAIDQCKDIKIVDPGKPRTAPYFLPKFVDGKIAVKPTNRDKNCKTYYEPIEFVRVEKKAFKSFFSDLEKFYWNPSNTEMLKLVYKLKDSLDEGDKDKIGTIEQNAIMRILFDPSVFETKEHSVERMSPVNKKRTTTKTGAVRPVYAEDCDSYAKAGRQTFAVREEGINVVIQNSPNATVNIGNKNPVRPVTLTRKFTRGAVGVATGSDSDRTIAPAEERVGKPVVAEEPVREDTDRLVEEPVVEEKTSVEKESVGEDTDGLVEESTDDGDDLPDVGDGESTDDGEISGGESTGGESTGDSDGDVEEIRTEETPVETPAVEGTPEETPVVAPVVEETPAAGIETAEPEVVAGEPWGRTKKKPLIKRIGSFFASHWLATLVAGGLIAVGTIGLLVAFAPASVAGLVSGLAAFAVKAWATPQLTVGIAVLIAAALGTGSATIFRNRRYRRKNEIKMWNRRAKIAKKLSYKRGKIANNIRILNTKKTKLSYAKVDKYTNEINKEAHRINELLSDMEKYSKREGARREKINTGKVVPGIKQENTLNTNAVIQETTSDMKERIQEYLNILEKTGPEATEDSKSLVDTFKENGMKYRAKEVETSVNKLKKLQEKIDQVQANHADVSTVPTDVEHARDKKSSDTLFRSPRRSR